MADVQTILQNAPLPQAVKANAWDAYQAAENEDDLVSRLNRLPLPKNVKADLWDAKHSESGIKSAAAEPEKPRTFIDFVLDFGKGYLNQMNPLPGLKALYDSPLGTLEGLGQAQIDQFKKAKDMYDQGRYSEAVGHTLAGAVPLMGPPAAEAGEKIAAGKIAEGLGAGGALLTPFAIDAVKGTMPAAKAASTLNKTEQAAIDFADSENIPLTAGNRSGNQIIKNAEGMIQNSVGGSGYAARVKNAQTEALQAAGTKVAGEVNPVVTSTSSGPGAAVTAEAAGNIVKDALNSKIAAHAAEADKAYGDLRMIEQNPSNAKTVTVGTQQQPIMQGNTHMGYQSVPVTRDIPLPVDMRPVKAALQPIYDRLKQTMPIAQQNASPGLKALENIMAGNDYVSASTADQNLSAIKGIARTDNPNLRNVAQGTAAAVVKQLESAVQDAVKQGGPGALDALNAGRAATKSKYAVADIADSLPSEPVQVFNRLTSVKDSNIDLLRDIAKHAPDAMPKIGRAYIEGLLDTATAEGGFQKAGTLLNKWNSLGDATKKTLFDPATVNRLDDFFLLGKRLNEVANPSRTAYVAQLVPTGVLLARDPIAGGTLLFGNAAVSRLLFSPQGSKLLTKAMTTPKLNTALATTTVSQLLKLAGSPETAENPSEQSGTPALAGVP